ncbi:MAG: sigma-70 family RNA polymerase sigma factor [Candidatus Aminicenantes bacterium]|nr:sigma-70 family RNA polymerase sigma factor [Candidatus Aminicenantes bacterium]
MKGPMDVPDDDRLVRHAKDGDLEAFAELARRHQRRIFHTVMNFMQNPADADDLTQETFLHAYRNLRNFRGGSSFFTWIYRIAVNLSLNHLKKHRREKGRTELRDDIALDPAGPAGSDPESGSLADELRRKLGEAVGSLPVPYQAAFRLVAVEGMSHGQAARILGCAENTVSWRMFKARRILQDRLKPYLEREVPHALF